MHAFHFWLCQCVIVSVRHCDGDHGHALAVVFPHPKREKLCPMCRCSDEERRRRQAVCVWYVCRLWCVFVGCVVVVCGGVCLFVTAWCV